MINANSSSITIFGEVRGPGTQPLPKQTRVAEAIGSAGGPTTRADMNGVYIVRSSGSTSQIIHVDLAAIRNGDLSTNAQLFSGDLIYVPPNLLAEIGYALQAVLFPFQPLLGLANSIRGQRRRSLTHSRAEARACRGRFRPGGPGSGVAAPSAAARSARPRPARP